MNAALLLFLKISEKAEYSNTALGRQAPTSIKIPNLLKAQQLKGVFNKAVEELGPASPAGTSKFKVESELILQSTQQK